MAMAMASNHEYTPPLPIVRREDVDEWDFYAMVWSRVFNYAHDLSPVPRAVVRPTHISHIQQTLLLAAKEQCAVSIRSGGHSWAAWSVRTDAILIDLGQLWDGGIEGIRFDALSGTVSCGPAITSRELNYFLERHGAFFPGSHCPDVGLGGLLLHGGMGWNCKNWGWACESVRAVDVVSANGKIVRCSQVENQDLFWAAKGSGLGFPAIVIRWHLQTRQLTRVLQSVYRYKPGDFRRVIQWVIDQSRSAEPDVEIVLKSHCPAHNDRQTVELLVTFTAFERIGNAAAVTLRSIHDSKPPGELQSHCALEVKLSSLYAAQDGVCPLGWRYCADNAYIDNAADIPVVLEDAFLNLPTKTSFAMYYPLFPTSRRASSHTALTMQSDHYFAIYGVWRDGDNDAIVREDIGDTMKHVDGRSIGTYLGDADFRVRRNRPRFWSQEEWKRIEEVRRTWDPEGRICGFPGEGEGAENEHVGVQDEEMGDD